MILILLTTLVVVAFFVSIAAGVKKGDQLVEEMRKYDEDQP